MTVTTVFVGVLHNIMKQEKLQAAVNAIFNGSVQGY